MTGKRLWLSAIVAAFGLFCATVPSFSAGDENAAGQAADAVDFQVLAVKPERYGKGYKLVPVGESKLDAASYDNVVRSLPYGLFGGPVLPSYDERAELAQCRSACSANAKCQTFNYVRPNKSRPIGVCHLRRASDHQVVEVTSPAPVAATPVPEAPPAPVAVVGPVVDVAEVAPQRELKTLTIHEKGHTGFAAYSEADAPETPVMFRFNAPVASVVATLRARDVPAARAWATVEVMDAKGRRIKRTGAWVSRGGHAQKLKLDVKAETVSAVKVTTNGVSTLTVDRLEFERMPAAVAATKVAKPTEIAKAEPEPAPSEAKADDTVEPVATEAPADITQAPAETQVPVEPTVGEAAPEVETPPSPTPAATAEVAAKAEPVAPVPAREEPTIPVVTPVAEPVSTFDFGVNEKDLPLLAGAFALMLGGVGLYRSGYRAKTLKRLATALVSDGLDRQTVSIEAEHADLSLRFSIRARAEAGARQTTITIVPDGVAA